jgi:hypothetical protein
MVAAMVAACGNDEAVPADGAPAIDAPAAMIDGAVADAAGADAAADAATADDAAVDAAVDAVPDAAADAAPDAAADAAEPAPSCVFSAAMVTVVESATAQVTVRPSVIPSAALTFSITSADPDAVAVSPATLMFAAGDGAPQPLTLSGVLDPDTLPENVQVTCATATPGGSAASISVQVIDQTDVFFVVSAASMTIDEGASGTLNLSLSGMFQQPVTVLVASSDADAVTVSPTSFEIAPANWGMPHPIVVSGVPDADTIDEDVSFTLMAQGIPMRTIAVRVNDDD